MICLLIRTDKPEAELYLYNDKNRISEYRWQAHRQLAETLHKKINQLLADQGLSLEDIKKIGVYQGPGSFTGLRIGISVANALSYGCKIPIIGATGESWLNTCIDSSGSQNPIIPEYGSDPHITKPKK